MRKGITVAAGVVAAVIVGVYFIIGGVVAAVTGSDAEDTAGPATCGGSGVEIQPIRDASGGFGSWDAEQMQNATVIAQRGIKDGVGSWGVTIALATAMQESTLRNLNHGDRDSLGLFQQRPSSGWGTQAQIRDPALSADAFFGVATHTGNPGLTDIPHWQDMSLAVAAQAVQRSAFPDAYAQHETEARALTDHILNDTSLPAADVKPVDCSNGDATPPTSGWLNPLSPASYNLSSPFGQRFHPIRHVWRLHAGLDMAAPTGTPIRAACSGRVIGAGWDPGGGGNVTTIDCGESTTTLYMHQSEMDVTIGSKVRVGDQIGLVGNTGGSTGAHLHYQVEVGGQPADPVPFMKERGAILCKEPNSTTNALVPVCLP